MKIVLGLDNLANLNVSFVPKVIRNIKEVKVHPKYQWKRAYSDVVILKMDKKVTFSETIYPVCLPDTENSNKNHLFKQSATIVGFGPKDNKSKKMRQINQRIRSHNYCNRRYKPENADIKLRSLIRKVLPDGLDDTLICAQNG